MWLKITGSVLIVAASAIVGFNAAARYLERPRQLRQIISCLTSLRAHINYAASPLPEALERCTNGINGPISELFKTMADLLSAEGWLTPQEAMKKAFGQVRNLVIKRPEQEVLEVFSANLGSMNREEQQKSLDLVYEQLLRIQYEAEKLSEQNVKMYRYLGVCSGLAIVIVLI